MNKVLKMKLAQDQKEKFLRLSDISEAELPYFLEGQADYDDYILNVCGNRKLVDDLTARIFFRNKISIASVQAIAEVILDSPAFYTHSNTLMCYLDVNEPAGSESCQTGVMIGPGVRWLANGRIMTPNMPETIMNVMIGKTPDDIFEDPDISKRGLTIIGAQQDIYTMVLETDYIPEEISVQDLLAIRDELI
jgi:hypothetical protein